MHISTPVHVPVSSDTALPAEQGAKTAQTKTAKTDKLGAFAKILDGLISKNPKIEGFSLKGQESKPSPQITAKPEDPQKNPGKKKDALAAKEPKIQKEFSAQRSKRGKTTPEEPSTEGALLTGEGKNLEKKPTDPLTSKQEKKASLSLQKPETQAKNPGQETLPKVVPPETQVPQILAQGSAEPEKPEGKTPKLNAKNPEPSGLQQKPRETGTQESKALQQSPQKTEKPETKLAEAKPKEKRRLNLDVRDLRGETVPQVSAQTQGTQGAPEIQAGTESKTAELTLDLSSGTKSRETVFRETDSRPAQAFEDILARELHQNLNGDIVRQAQIILREHGEGSIRLALKPESLGNVKIQLEMTENKITGHIIVESGDALRAFEREIRSLEQAFKESGFAGASLDMSLAGGDPGSRDRQEHIFLTEQAAAGLYSGAGETPREQSAAGLSLVNMLA